jgi:2-dehydro-3-deoxygluconokinase
MSARLDVVCVGETMAQLVPPGNGGLAVADVLRLSVAGAESNVAQVLAQLGDAAAWAGRLGADPVGDRVLAHVRGFGVDVSLVRRTSDRTGLFLKDPRPEGSTVYYYRDGSAASTLSIDDVDRALVRTPRILHLSGVTPALSASCRQAVHHALRQARAVGVVTSFDVNYRSALWKPADCADELRELPDAAHVTFAALHSPACRSGRSSSSPSGLGGCS